MSSVEDALDAFPQRLRTTLLNCYVDSPSAAAMMQRGDMPPARALMAGISIDPQTRDRFDEALTIYADTEQDLPDSAPEVVIGGGAHAAIYAATRVARGLQPPLVLEKNERFGGVFAMTRRSTFFLNSRNRPGPLGAPGSRDALNVIAGAPMQPSDLSGREYQENADLGLVVRCTLALNARVRTATVEGVERNGEQMVVTTDRGVVRTNRVVVTTGLGERKTFRVLKEDGRRVFSFESFMRRLDSETFPLRGLGRVAVAGGGDSGRTVIEALAGYGPTMPTSVASLDYVPQIDWWGIEQGMTKERWLTCNRTRYKPLAALFPTVDGNARNARVRALQKVGTAYQEFDSVRLNGESYDTVIYCFGFKQSWPKMIGMADSPEPVDYLRVAGSQGAALGLVNADRTLVVLGVAADLPFESVTDPEPLRTTENRVALFRLAPRTAGAAMLLP